MSDITEQSIQQCSLTLGQFDSKSVNVLVTLFHHQNACSQFILLSNHLKEKFENLLTTKRDDDDEKSSDTPLTRIELAIMIHFKQKYLSDSVIDNDNHQLKSNIKISIDDELNLAYCYLLAQIDDRCTKKVLSDLEFLLKVGETSENLFQIYKKLGTEFSTFFSLLLRSGCFAKNLVLVDQMIRDFQSFIQRYEDFLITFEKHYKILPDNRTNSVQQTDAILCENNTQKISTFIIEVLSTNPEQKKAPSTSVVISPPVEQPQQIISRSPSNVPQKALCVIINITKFSSTQPIDTPQRAGSDKDVDLIKVVFKKLNFTVLECRYDFTKNDVERALDYIDNGDEFGHYDCLVMFIMSHGLLHSFFTADSREFIIRDIVLRFSDTSKKTIWAKKSRLFFIQACRSLWPEHIKCSTREGIHQNDLSPGMLVAYSCSASEASKRSPTVGSIFIQILCIMLLRYGHYLHIQIILDWTAKFVIKRDQYSADCKGIPVSIQQPEFIQREFNSNFRFSDYSLYEKYQTWERENQIVLYIPLRIWKEIYDLVFINITTGN